MDRLIGNILWLTKNNLKRTFRKKSSLIIIFLMPILLTAVLAYFYHHNLNVLVRINIIDIENPSIGIAHLSIGFLLIFIMISAALSAERIIKEKKNRTYYRICTAAVKEKTYILGSMLASIVTIIVQVFFVLLFITEVLKFNIYMSFIQLFFILVLFGITAICLGLMITAFSTEARAASATQSLVIAATCVMGGCFWSTHQMSKSIQKIAELLPQNWVIEAIDKLQRGEAFDEVLMNIIIILAFALTFLVIAAYRFNRNERIKTFI